MIPTSNLFSKIQSVVTLEDVLQKIVGEDATAPAGRLKKANCLFHDETEPSMHLYPEGRFHCFGCGASGDVVDLYAHAKEIESPIEALYELANEFGATLPGRDPHLEARLRERRVRERELLAESQRLQRNSTTTPNSSSGGRAGGSARNFVRDTSSLPPLTEAPRRYPTSTPQAASRP
jgi:DNA primase